MNMNMNTIFKKISNYFIETEPEEETQEEKILRIKHHNKLLLLSKSERNNLLNELKGSIHDLYVYLAENDKKTNITKTNDNTNDNNNKNKIILNDTISIVTKLCTNIDNCCNHGLRRVENDKTNYVQFFGLLKWTCSRIENNHEIHLAIKDNYIDTIDNNKRSIEDIYQHATSSLTPEMDRNIRGFKACMRTANSLSKVKTDEGKVRAFIRQALNTHVLKDCLESIIQENNIDLLLSYYTEYSLFRQYDDVHFFLSLLNNLNKLSFGFIIDDPRMDKHPSTLPFLIPLPKSLPQTYTIKPPELVDPEDMLDGRIRLSYQDNECNILANKLVSECHLNKKYDESIGGNPLSDVLKKSKLNYVIQDSAKAVCKYLEINEPEFEVFGAELETTINNPFLSGMARFNINLSIPDVPEACITYLKRKLMVPGLFQTHLAADHVIDLRDAIEELGGFHRSMAVDPHEVVAILLQYLWELPDPIFTEERWEAFLSCLKLDNMDQQIRNLQFLLEDLPSSHKPLLERILDLCNKALEIENAKKSGIDISRLSLLFSPVLFRSSRPFILNDLDEPSFRRFPIAGHIPLRHRLPPDFYTEYNKGEAELAAAEARNARLIKRQTEQGARILCILIKEQKNLLKNIQNDLNNERKKLKDKVKRMENLRFSIEEKIDIKKPEHVLLLKKLWDGLLPLSSSSSSSVVCDISNNILNEEEQLLASSKTNEEWRTNKKKENDIYASFVDVDILLKSPRWKLSGFHTDNPLGGFRGGGLLSLECLAFFVHEYPDKAKIMMKRNALPGGDRYPFPVASINVIRMLLKLLMVDQPPESPSKVVLYSDNGKDEYLEMNVCERVSRTPFWSIFDDINSFQKLHSMAFMLLDLHWTRAGATQMGFNPVLDSTRRQIGWLLEQGPKSVEEMWEIWMKAKENQLKKITKVKSNKKKNNKNKNNNINYPFKSNMISFASINESIDNNNKKTLEDDLSKHIIENIRLNNKLKKENNLNIKATNKEKEKENDKNKEKDIGKDNGKDEINADDVLKSIDLILKKENNNNIETPEIYDNVDLKNEKYISKSIDTVNKNELSEWEINDNQEDRFI